MDRPFESSCRLPEKEVSLFLNQHHLGNLKYLKSISKGIESHTYSIITETNLFVLTLFTTKTPNLSFMKETSDFFTAKGFPFAKILATGEITNKPAIITSHLTGKGKNDWTEEDYESIGFLLGNLHKSASLLTSSSPNLPFIWGLSTTFFEIKQRIPKEFHRLEEEIFTLEEIWPHDLPKGLIHGDIWHKKILFSEGIVTGILDFNPSYEPFTLDLANLIKGIPSENSTFLPALLTGYEVARPLSSEELASLDIFAYAKIISTTLYLLKQSIHHPARKDEFQTYAYLNLLKLDSLLSSYTI